MYPEVTSVYVPVKTKDYRALAILLSIIGHSVLLGGVVYFHKEAPPPPMQTMLISPEELAEMQSQIQANTSDGENNVGETASQKPKETDPNTAKLMQQIAEQEALFQQNKAKMAEQVDKEFNAQQQQMIEELNEELAERQAMIEDFERAEANIDEIEAKLRSDMAKAEQQNRERIESQRIRAENKDIATDGERLLSENTNKAKGSSGEKRGSQGANVANYRDAIVSKIYGNWQPPTNSDGKSLRVTLKLSPTGAVLSTGIFGDDPFSKSLREAINKSSPLPVPSDPELFQKSFASLTIKFEGK